MEKLLKELGQARNIMDFKYFLRLPSEHLDKLPQIPAVYFLHTPNDLIFYIGSSLNLKKRVSAYAMWFRTLAGYGIKPIFIAWLPITEVSDLRNLEEGFIRTVRPPLNGIHYRLQEGPSKRERKHSYFTVAAMNRQRAV